MIVITKKKGVPIQANNLLSTLKAKITQTIKPIIDQKYFIVSFLLKQN